MNTRKTLETLKPKPYTGKEMDSGCPGVHGIRPGPHSTEPLGQSGGLGFAFRALGSGFPANFGLGLQAKVL